MKNNILERVKLNKNEKDFLWQLLSMFYENKDNMYYEIDSDTKALKSFENLSKACGYFPDKHEMDEKTVQKCLKRLGS